MPEVKLIAEARTEFGKGAARRIRRADKIPAVLYGHGSDPVHITLPGHDTLLALRTANALLSVVLDGNAQLALPKQVQRDPIKHTIEHVDLVLVSRGEKVTVDVAVVVEGEAGADTLVVVDTNTVTVDAEATHIPTEIVVSVEGLAAGTQILARRLVAALGLRPAPRPRCPDRQRHQRADRGRGRGRAGRGRGGGRDRADRGRRHRCRGRRGCAGRSRTGS